LLPLTLPLDIEDPVERLKAVSARSSAMKSAHIAEVISLLCNGMGWAPPFIQQSLAALPILPQPVLMFNMVCTNVPGPMVPLYSNGRELLTYYPHVPCGSDVGISVAASSYNRTLYFGVTYDCQAAPDGELFRDFLIEAYTELREAAGVPADTPAGPVLREVPAVDEPVCRSSQVSEVPRESGAAAAGTEAVPAEAPRAGAQAEPIDEVPVQPAPVAEQPARKKPKSAKGRRVGSAKRYARVT